MCYLCETQTSTDFEPHPDHRDDPDDVLIEVDVLLDNNSDLPSFDWDQAAAQISRWNSKWDDEVGANGNALGTPGTVTYGYLANPGDTEFPAITFEEMANVELAILNYEEVANLDFIRITDPGSEYVSNGASTEMDIQGIADTNGGWMSGSFGGGTFHSATVSIGERDLEIVGSWAFSTAIHEIGHGIGFPHPGDYNGSDLGDGKEYYEDSGQYSVMSYFDEADTGAEFGNGWYWVDGAWERGVWQHTGLMLHDIAALQRLYGANMTTRTGDSHYGWNSNLSSEVWSVDDWTDNIVAAIWDAGGEDTIDASGWNVDQVIDLREEAFSSIGTYEHNSGVSMVNNVAIARGVKIENAIGGPGNDLLIGNNADPNHSDADGIRYRGHNILDGGGGRNTVSYEFGKVAVDIDLALGGDSARGYTYDLLRNGKDTLKNIRDLIGSQFDDTLVASMLGSKLEGGEGDDNLLGRAASDILIGGPGDDFLNGRSGYDKARLSGRFEDYRFSYDGDFSATDLNADDGDGGTDVFLNIEEITFADRVYAILTGKTWNIYERPTNILTHRIQFELDTDTETTSFFETGEVKDITFYDGSDGRNWESTTDRYNTEGDHVGFHRLFDNGRSLDKVFENGNLVAMTNTEVDGDIKAYTYFASGTRKSVSVTDNSDSRSWQMISRTFDVNNQLVEFDRHYDDGLILEQTFTNGWLSEEIETEPDGDVKTTQFFQNGNREVFIFYDGSDTRSWETLTKTYDVGGNLVSEERVLDDGTVKTTNYMPESDIPDLPTISAEVSAAAPSSGGSSLSPSYAVMSADAQDGFVDHMMMDITMSHIETDNPWDLFM